jgi:hypothetical protein
MAIPVGPGDVPSSCAVCGQVTLHRPDSDGKLHCMACLARGAQPSVAPVPAQPKKQGGDVVVGTIKTAGFIVAVLFLLSIATCVGVCGYIVH